MKTSNRKNKMNSASTKKILILIGSVAIILSALVAGIVWYFRQIPPTPSPREAQAIIAREQLKELDALRNQFTAISPATSTASVNPVSVKVIVNQQLKTLDVLRQKASQSSSASSTNWTDRQQQQATVQQQLEELNKLRSK